MARRRGAPLVAEPPVLSCRRQTVSAGTSAPTLLRDASGASRRAGTDAADQADITESTLNETPKAGTPERHTNT